MQCYQLCWHREVEISWFAVLLLGTRRFTGSRCIAPPNMLSNRLFTLTAAPAKVNSRRCSRTRPGLERTCSLVMPSVCKAFRADASSFVSPTTHNFGGQASLRSTAPSLGPGAKRSGYFLWVAGALYFSG